MKKYFILFLTILLVAGCGSKKEESSMPGSSSGKTDYVAQGMKFLIQKDVTKAIQNFDMAIKQDPKNPENYIVLGEVYMRLNDLPRAIDSFEAATRVAPRDGDAYYLLAVSNAFRGHRKDAIAAAQKSMYIYNKTGNEIKFKKTASLLKSLIEADQSVSSSSQSAAQNLDAIQTQVQANSLPAASDAGTKN